MSCRRARSRNPAESSQAAVLRNRSLDKTSYLFVREDGSSISPEGGSLVSLRQRREVFTRGELIWAIKVVIFCGEDGSLTYILEPLLTNERDDSKLRKSVVPELWQRIMWLKEMCRVAAVAVPRECCG